LTLVQELYQYGLATKDEYTKLVQSYQEYVSEIKSGQRDEAAASTGHKRCPSLIYTDILYIYIHTVGLKISAHFYFVVVPAQRVFNFRESALAYDTLLVRSEPE